MTEYVVSRLALDTLEESGYIGLSSFEADGYHMILHDALVDEDDNPGDGWQWNCETWEYPLREIVRCRDCKHFGTRNGLGLCKRWSYFSICSQPDDFCSRAERRGSVE